MKTGTWRWWLHMLALAPAGCLDFEGSAIVDRSSTSELVCSATKSMAEPYKEYWGAYDVLSSGDDAVWSARAEVIVDPAAPPIENRYKLLLAPLDAHGAFGSAVDIPVVDASNVSSVRVTQTRRGPAVLWLSDGWLQRAAFDEQGEPLDMVQNRNVATEGELEDANGLQVASADNGQSLASWYQYQEHSHTNRSFVVAIDSHGTMGELQDLSTNVTRAPALVAAHGGGYAALWSRLPNRLVETTDIVFATLDEAGRIQGEPHVLRHNVHESGGRGFGGGEQALLAVERGYLAAWTERLPGDGDHDGYGASGVIYVARLSAQGELQGEPVLLAAATPDVELVDPSFTRMGNAVAVAWARGSVIYLCAGCTPDHSVHMLVIDPRTLTPKSNETVIKPPIATMSDRPGGLLHRRTGSVGTRDLVMLVGVQFHTWYQPAFAAIHCEPQ